MTAPITAALILAAIVCAVAIWSVLVDEGGDSFDLEGRDS